MYAAGQKADTGGTSDGTVALPIGKGVVLGVESSQGSDAVIVELQIGRDDVPQITAASTAGTVSIALIAPGS